MTWQPEIEAIEARRQRALQMGGVDKIAKQHAQGKLTARERIARLLDEYSFTEVGMLATHQSQRPEMRGLLYGCRRYHHRLRSDRWPRGVGGRGRLHGDGRVGGPDRHHQT